MRTSRARNRLLSAARAALPSAAGPGRILLGLDRMEHAERAERLVEAVRIVVRAVPLGRGRDLLHDRWVGHPVHPLMVQVPLGSWMSAAVLHFVPGQQRAASMLVGTGLVTALPAAAAGWADWAQLRRPQMWRLTHAAVNAAGVACYGVSFVARARGRFARGRLWGMADLAAVSVGGVLGGHMSFRQASGANHAEHVAELERLPALGRLEHLRADDSSPTGVHDPHHRFPSRGPGPAPQRQRPGPARQRRRAVVR